MISPPRRLLIIKPSSFGDIVHALPALDALHRSWAETSIDWLVNKEWAGLLHDHPMLESVLHFPGNFTEWRMLREHFRQRPYDMTIDLQGLLRSGMISLMTGSRIRVGFASGREGSSWFYTRRFRTAHSAMHAVDRNLDLVRQLGISTNGPITFPLPMTPESSAWVANLWVTLGISPTDRVCLVHPAARWATKRWPAENFAEMADRLVGQSHSRVIFIAAESQNDQVQQVLRRMNAQATNLTGQTTLTQLTALLRKASVLISNDSGPMHLAAAIGTPVVGIFGPTDPRKVGPYGQAHGVIHKGYDCTGCGRQRCRHGLHCLRTIDVEDVVRLIDRRLMEGKPVSSQDKESFESIQRGWVP